MMSFCKFINGTKVHTGEVQYFTCLAISNPEEEWSFSNVAILKLYLEPDIELLHLSSQVLAVFRLLNNIFVCDVKNICSVIAIILHTLTLPSGIEGNFFEMVEKPGLDISDLGVLYSIYSQPEDDEDDQGSDDADVE